MSKLDLGYDLEIPIGVHVRNDEIPTNEETEIFCVNMTREDFFFSDKCYPRDPIFTKSDIPGPEYELAYVVLDNFSGDSGRAAMHSLVADTGEGTEVERILSFFVAGPGYQPSRFPGPVVAEDMSTRLRWSVNSESQGDPTYGACAGFNIDTFWRKIK